MKIVSKFKDYYDWVVFETDNRKVYVRDRKIAHFKGYPANELGQNEVLIDKDIRFLFLPDYPHIDHLFSNYHIMRLHICGEWFVGLCDRRDSNAIKYYWEINKIPQEVLNEIRKSLKKYKAGWLYKLWDGKTLGLMVDREKKPVESRLTKQLNVPVILQDFAARSVILNPNLSEIDFKLIKPERIYQSIYNFIEYIEPSNLPGSPDDMNRYEAKGFDKKTSFRPKMK